MTKLSPDCLHVRAIRTRQGNTNIYVAFVLGSELLKIADIARLERDTGGELQGFQRPEIRQHIRAITAYLDKGDVIFPNALILALSPEVTFRQSRGPAVSTTFEDCSAGLLSIPARPSGKRIAWIVDGQQRSMALASSKNGNIPVPVVAFETSSIDTQREQFILVNRAKPLPQRLVDELLPQTSGIFLPKSLSARRIPSVLCDALEKNTDSPFYGLIRRPSQLKSQGVVQDTAITHMIQRSIRNPNGALAIYQGLGVEGADVGKMYMVLRDFWGAAKDVFGNAWGLPPQQSRLMHSVGIIAMADLMDRISARVTSGNNMKVFFAGELRRIAKDCAWTQGQWKQLNREWNEFENTKKDIKLLSQILVQTYARRSST